MHLQLTFSKLSLKFQFSPCGDAHSGYTYVSVSHPIRGGGELSNREKFVYSVRVRCTAFFLPRYFCYATYGHLGTQGDATLHTCCS